LSSTNCVPGNPVLLRVENQATRVTHGLVASSAITCVMLVALSDVLPLRLATSVSQIGLVG